MTKQFFRSHNRGRHRILHKIYQIRKDIFLIEVLAVFPSQGLCTLLLLLSAISTLTRCLEIQRFMQMRLLYTSTEQEFPHLTLQVGCNTADLWAFRGGKKAAKQSNSYLRKCETTENLLEFDEEALQTMCIYVYKSCPQMINKRTVFCYSS